MVMITWLSVTRHHDIAINENHFIFAINTFILKIYNNRSSSNIQYYTVQIANSIVNIYYNLWELKKLCQIKGKTYQLILF
jgi:hypothetical protein